ncbi:MAG: hypothetical protein AAFQ98_03485 [Bacteroidota bacterium]
MAEESKQSRQIQAGGLSKIIFQVFDLARKERAFLFIIGVLTLICALAFPNLQYAMWVGFGLSAYSAIANDSIQTIGTFIASNSQRKWWILWLFMGGIFLATVTYSFMNYDGDVSYGRLATKGLETAPISIGFLQLFAPIVLLILTRMRMPVSTTFLLLNIFATKVSTVSAIILKSLSGYFIAFLLAIVVWFAVRKWVDKLFTGKPGSIWIILQWLTSGALWCFWLQQDAANIAVFLPRQLSQTEFLAFAGFIFAGLGLLFYLKGDRIQGIVNEKSGVTDIRAATLVDFIYAIILFVFKIQSNIPMSTTWVFIGLLGGRELAIAMTKKLDKRRKEGLRKSWRMVRSDAGRALIGLLVSLILALIINENFRNGILGLSE